MAPWVIGIATALAVIAAMYLIGRFQRVRVNAWQRGAVYRDGAFERLLPPGVHRIWKGAGHISVQHIDLTPRYHSVGPVEATSADRMPLRLSATALIELTDAERSVREDVWTPVTLAVSAALVRLATNHPMEALMARAPELDVELTALLVAPDTAVRISGVTLTGVVPPPEVRRMMTEVERARLEGLAALERARGEQAALRALANAARLMKDNPELERLRLLQSVGKGATLVIGDPASHPTGGKPK